MQNESLINIGGAIKALKTEGDLVTVGGYLVTFGDEGSKDFDGDFFTAKTYFGARQGDGVDVLFHHGLPLPVKSTDPELAAKVSKMADQILGTVKTKVDEHGLFAETILSMADDYQATVAQMAIAGKLGWSSGAISHAVRRKDGAKNGEVERWIIGEASLTPTPCDKRNFGTVLPLKTYIAREESPQGIKAQYLGNYVETEITVAALDAMFWALKYEVLYDALYDVREGEATWAEKRKDLEAALGEMSTLILKVVDAVMNGQSEQSPEMATKFLEAKKSNDGASLVLGLTNAELRQALVSGAKSYPALQSGLKAKRETDSRNYLTEQKKTELEAVSTAFKSGAAEIDALLTPTESNPAVDAPAEAPPVMGDELNRYLSEMSRSSLLLADA